MHEKVEMLEVGAMDGTGVGGKCNGWYRCWR